jgi:D-Tyr-tRNAtyr deacylase
MPLHLLVQQSKETSLLVDNVDRYIDSVHDNTVIFIGFSEGEGVLPLRKAVKQVLKAKIHKRSQVDGKGPFSGGEVPRDLVLIPHACLCGKINKSGAAHYYGQVDKEKGRALYAELVQIAVEVVQELAGASTKVRLITVESEGDDAVADPAATNVIAGTYGNTQGLRLNAAFGPNSHSFTFPERPTQ